MGTHKVARSRLCAAAAAMPPKRSKRSADASSAVILEKAGREADLRGSMAAMWREGRFTDLEVVVEYRSFRVHRVLVCSESEYMKTMCESEHFVEGRSCRVE